MKNKKQIIWCIILTLGLMLFFATGCKSVKYVPVEKIKIEYRDRLIVDSIYNRDTVSIYQKNDTIYYEKIKWRERFKIDTVSVVRVDSIPYPVEVIKEVNRLTKWQQMRLKAFNLITLVVAIFLILKLRKI